LEATATKTQRLVFFTQESPPALKPNYNMSELGNFFNWTMTYRTDADIPLLYGRIIPKETAPHTAEEINFTRQIIRNRGPPTSLHNKTKMAAWIVSYCSTHGQRELYVKELSKYVDIDSYGQCGNLSYYIIPVRIVMTSLSLPTNSIYRLRIPFVQTT
jgi:alpha-1,3-fucosyltransferase